MGGIGVPELLIILVIVILVFGANRLSGLGGALGGGIREFKQALRDETPEAPAAEAQPPATRAEPDTSRE